MFSRESRHLVSISLPNTSGVGASAAVAAGVPSSQQQPTSIPGTAASAAVAAGSRIVENLPIQQKSNMHPLEGRFILITGASSGIGAAIARAVAHHRPAEIILFARTSSKLDVVRNSIETIDANVKVTNMEVDVQDYDAVERAIAAIVSKGNHIDVLINNAGLALGAPNSFPNLSIKDILQTASTNINGLMYTTYATLNLGKMMERKEGIILNVTSTTALDVPPFPGESIYHTSKAAQEAFSNVLRNELQGTNIKVLALRPGVVGDTQFHHLRVGHDQKQFEQFVDGFDPLAANEVADAAIYMLSTNDKVSIKALDIVPTAQRSLPVIDRTWSKRNS